MSQPSGSLRHNVLLLVDASPEGGNHFLRRQGKAQGGECPHSMVDLGHGGVLAHSGQENISGFIGQGDLKGAKVGLSFRD